MDAMEKAVQDVLDTIARYQAESLPILVEYFASTVEAGEVDMDVGFAILKLYQMHKSSFDASTAIGILMSSLLALPSNDFSQCLCLIANHNLPDDKFKPVKYLHELLETCRFEQFWQHFHANESLAQLTFNVPAATEEDDEGEQVVTAEPHTIEVTLSHFSSQIIQYISHVVNITYQTVSVADVRKILGEPSERSFEAICDEWGWTVQGDNVFVGTKEDTIKSKDIVKQIEFKSLVPVLSFAEGNN